MTLLILGLLIFLGTHSVRIFAEGWRNAQRQRLGENVWKLVYTVASLLGFALLVWGYGQARQVTSQVWVPPTFMRHIAATLLLIAFIFLAAAYVPRNSIKAKLHHPMTLAVKIWAFAHLLANGSATDMVLFGAFLVWAIACFRAARARDRQAGTVYPAGTMLATALTVVIGVVAYGVMAMWLHKVLIGVRPFG